MKGLKAVLSLVRVWLVRLKGEYPRSYNDFLLAQSNYII